MYYMETKLTSFFLIKGWQIERNGKIALWSQNIVNHFLVLLSHLLWRPDQLEGKHLY